MYTLQTKFRPSLTIDEINTILTHLPAHETGIINQLNKFRLKAIHGIATPSHVTTPRQSLEDSLGFGDSPSMSTPSNQLQTAEQLYAIWQTHPQTLNNTQLTQVAHYRYTNDMMTPDEESQYESGL